MIAFHGKQDLADQVRAQVQHHFEADEIIKGQHWEGGKGCAVGCILHGPHHQDFETVLGIPEEIAFLLDGLFEALPNGSSKELPRRFVNAIQPGADLSMVIPQFLLWLLAEDEEAVNKTADMHATTKAFVDSVVALFEAWVASRNQPTEDSPLAWAAWAARDAWDAWAAWDARAAWVARAARAAWDARAARAAWAAWAAWDARDARAARAARTAWVAWAAWDARDARDARDAWAARAARNKRAADKLIQLLADAPIKEAA